MLSLGVQTGGGETRRHRHAFPGCFAVGPAACREYSGHGMLSPSTGSVDESDPSPKPVCLGSGS